MITCYLRGGLGNQLFQIFTTIAYALKHSQAFFFLNQYQLGDGSNGSTIRYTYWNTFLQSLQPFVHANGPDKNEVSYIRESNFHYEELPELTNTAPVIMLMGYFQSPRYFDNYKSLLFKLIKLDLNKTSVKRKTTIPFTKNSHISIHFRIGDYKYYPKLYTILDTSYYSNAIQHILENQTNKHPTLLYFCEDCDLTVVEATLFHLHLQFPTITFVRASPLLSDWEQMLLMSMCSHNIIANSTFSWWGAHFNSNDDKIVCYPSQWFSAEDTTRNTIDLFPENWTPIS